jgi:uncharacterized cupredoxin-like copper-binding protein
MSLTARKWFVIASTFAVTFAAGQAFAAGNVVKVTLWDKGDNPMKMPGNGKSMGMGEMGQDMSMALMGLKLSTDSVAAGEVTFEVENTSKELEHEMVVTLVKDTKTPLPAKKGNNQVDEKAAGSVGEVSELKPGKSGTLKVTLTPGSYILYCNVAGHYKRGMWSILTVK